jgi:DNA-binding transcriptional MerR regulator
MLFARCVRARRKPYGAVAKSGAAINGMSVTRKKARKAGASPEPVIPDKLYFRIGEVAKLCKLPAYVLRFWESEFPQLKPVKGSTGQRMYRQRDVENALHIKKLLYEEGFTIAGARQQLKAESKLTVAQSGLPFPRQSRTAELKKVRQGLQEILVLLKKKR